MAFVRKVCCSLLLVITSSCWTSVIADPQLGEKKVAVVLAQWSDAPAPDSAAMATWEGLYNVNVRKWFLDVSYDQLDLTHDFFSVTSPVTEYTDAAGKTDCRDQDENRAAYADKFPDGVPGLNPAEYEFVVWLVLATGCVGSAGANTYDGVVIITMTDAWYSGSGGSSLYWDCTSFDQPYSVCNPVVLHEMLHALGLGYHQNAVECAPTVPLAESRDCPVTQYGNRLDMLGSASYKMSDGLSAFPRIELGWMQDDGADGHVRLVTETTTGIELAAIDATNDEVSGTELPRAIRLQFTDPATQELADFVVEFRQAHRYDTDLGTKNTQGIIVNYNNVLVDLYIPDNVDADDSDTGYFQLNRVTLNPGETWTDPASNLVLGNVVVSPASGSLPDYVSFSATFGAPPQCERGTPQLSIGLWGEWRFFLEKGPSAHWSGPDGLGVWQEQAINGGTGDYAPFWDNADLTIISYLTAVKNTDVVTCGSSSMSIRPLNLPANWMFHEGGTQTTAAGMEGTGMTFSIGIPSDAQVGFYSLFLQPTHDGTEFQCIDQVEGSAYQLGVCVGGYNSWFQGIGNNRSPKWECITGAAPDGNGGFQDGTKHEGTDLADVWDGPFRDSEVKCTAITTQNPTPSPTPSPNKELAKLQKQLKKHTAKLAVYKNANDEKKIKRTNKKIKRIKRKIIRLKDDL
jgi:hypothetical protein